jgi:hypothetical protein
MIYTINTSKYTPIYRSVAKAKFKRNAFKRLQLFPCNTTEKLLDNYLQEQYQLTLRYACYLIIRECTIEEQQDDLVVTIKNKHLDKLARIITYGTGKFSGSRILSFIFQKI